MKRTVNLCKFYVHDHALNKYCFSGENAVNVMEEYHSEENMPEKVELRVQEERPSFEHVTVKEEHSFDDSMLIKEEMSCQIKEEPEVQMKEEPSSDDEQLLMSAVKEESGSDEFPEVDIPDKLEDQMENKLPSR